ncbi:ubiquinol-cytochrome c reductase iron-sulfur subunit [Candidatus Photodesmus katoptron]|uniref:Ubiquinol-cytochrome c reductase iron-sulfur subunit n=1 Tax=Candidatus Photodesmus katoptron Akat1 TaxID=1236703 RepID=S3DKY7_9GAMM|nr:ubiquinol-cytochrome c reductase iron-sulfur subunit [Candidatus Photodesmus katoptron]EPE37774.1 ubiquinol-cytochrome c reductase, iron-sulfur subunit [Candidatus Photodesmus katoptron Akat1]KEY90505.1 ubiquinol-cytochrome c reductase iron-sulfur subunit [Candidatus Photodesmus katoptron]
MSDSPSNKSRRQFLISITAVFGSFALLSIAIPFIKSWNPSKKAKAAGAPVEIDISKLQEGEMIRVKWRGKPVWVVRRTQSSLDNLLKLNNQLRDPNSKADQQPVYAQNTYRSIKPEYFIAVGICTHLGCSPSYLSKKFSEQVQGVESGFFCPCHGSKFDIAGRVFQGVPAPSNLIVPKHMYLSDTQVVIGIDEK